MANQLKLNATCCVGDCLLKNNMDDSQWIDKNNPMMSQGSSLDVEGQTLVSLNEVKQGTEDFGDTLIVQSAEEVIDSDLSLSQKISPTEMPVPIPDNSEGKKRKGSKKSKKLGHNSKSAKKWEHKSVKIKTLEGEFSASMWASGKILLCYFV